MVKWLQRACTAIVIAQVYILVQDIAVASWMNRRA